MKFLSFKSADFKGIRLGALLNSDRALDLVHAHMLINTGVATIDSLQCLIESGTRGLDWAEALIEHAPTEAVVNISELTFAAPLPVPMQIRDFANYELHCKQALSASMQLRASKEPDPEAALERFKASGAYSLPDIWYEIPLYYKANRFNANGHECDVEWPAFSEALDYELELAAIIGKQGRDIKKEDAAEHIFGYTIFNDFSARDVHARWEGQFRMGPAKGKDFDTSNVFGPWVVTRDEIANPYNLEMIVRVNGEERGRGNSGDVQHNFERCIEQVSWSETIYPGEIFGLGTVGNGSGFESLTFLEPGDVVELEIEGIGVLRNRIVRSPVP